MARGEKKDRPRRRPGTTLESRENQLINDAVDLAERQIREGTASSQVLTHFLKLGTTRERLEQERLQHENELTAAKIEHLKSGARIEELYAEAMQAMRTYQGRPEQDVAEG